MFRAAVMVKTALRSLLGSVRAILKIFLKKDQNRLANCWFAIDLVLSATQPTNSRRRRTGTKQAFVIRFWALVSEFMAEMWNAVRSLLRKN